MAAPFCRFNNPWTLQTTNSLPFTLREGTTIQERDGQKRSWSVDPHSRASSEEDYALITRLLHSTIGGPSIAVAGVGQSGTQAAAELLTDPDKVRGLVQNAPEGWETKNLEIVLRVKVLQYQPVATETVAEKAW